jgi:N-acetylglucosaminyldiphosphoundecaprenol N-acetyl-beta-D-mannosaminyltransferase
VPSVEDARHCDKPAAGAGRPGKVQVCGVGFDCLTEAQVVDRVIAAARLGRGGYIVTPNIDICRAASRNPAQWALVAGASLVVPDGMPLLWAARILGSPLKERVTGASLIFSLTEAAARHGRSIYLLGGRPGVPDKAGEMLRRRYPGLVVAGADAPPPGFDQAPSALDAVQRRVAAASPDIVYVGLGFPKQERLIARLAGALPGTWFVACGAAIPYAAGAFRRAPRWMQRAGLEWVFRLLSEPRRLFRRYIIHDVPFAAWLLASCAAARIRHAAGRSGKGREPASRSEPGARDIRQAIAGPGQGVSRSPRTP